MGKKNILMWGMVVMLMLFMTTNSFAQEEKKGPRIKIIKGQGEEGKGKEIQFVDETGKIKKKISLETKWDTVTKTVDGGNKKTYHLRRQTYKKARSSANGKFAAVLTNVTDISYTDESGNEHYIDGGYVSGKIALLDENGNVLWEKQLPDKRPVGEEPFIADNGETVAVDGVLSLGGESEDPANMFVFDKSGNVILRFPGLQLERLSPNGKYLAATVAHGQSLITRFYNVTNKKYWDSTEKYTIFKLSDDGLVRADTGGKSPIVNIDLQNYIGD